MLGNNTNTLNPNSIPNTNDNSNNDKLEMMSQRILTKSYKM